MESHCSVCHEALLKRVELNQVSFENLATQIFCKVHNCQTDSLVKMKSCHHYSHLSCFLNYTRKLWSVQRDWGFWNQVDLFCPKQKCLSKYREVNEIDIIPYGHFVWASRNPCFPMKCRDELRVFEDTDEVDIVAEAINKADLSPLISPQTEAKLIGDLLTPKSAFDWPDLMSIPLPTSCDSGFADVPMPSPSPNMSISSDGSDSGYSSSEVSVIIFTSDEELDGLPRMSLSSDNEEPIQHFGNGEKMVTEILDYLNHPGHKGQNYNPVVIAHRTGADLLTLDLERFPIEDEKTKEEDTE